MMCVGGKWTQRECFRCRCCSYFAYVAPLPIFAYYGRRRRTTDDDDGRRAMTTDDEGRHWTTTDDDERRINKWKYIVCYIYIYISYHNLFCTYIYIYIYTSFVRKTARLFFHFFSLLRFLLRRTGKMKNWTFFYRFSKWRHSGEKLVKNWEGGSAKNW